MIQYNTAFQAFESVVRLGTKTAAFGKVTTLTDSETGEVVSETVEVLWGLSKADVAASIDRDIARLDAGRAAKASERTALTTLLVKGDVRV